MIGSAGALLCAVPAHADPATDFLTQLREAGYDPGSSSYDQSMTLINAAAACNLLHYDFTPEQARGYLRNQYPGVALTDLALMVDVAQQTLCKAQFAPVEPDW